MYLQCNTDDKIVEKGIDYVKQIAFQHEIIKIVRIYLLKHLY